VTLLEGCSIVKTAFDIPTQIQYIDDLERLAPIFGVHIDRWIEFYIRTHSDVNIKSSAKEPLSTLIALHNNEPKTEQITHSTFGKRKWHTLIGREVKMSDEEWIKTVQDSPVNSRMKLAAMNVPPSMRPMINYRSGVTTVESYIETIARVNGKLTTLSELFEFCSTFIALDFDVPMEMVFFNTPIEEFDVTVLTITNADDLQKNARQLSNCTSGLKSSLKDGRSVLWKITDAKGKVYNTAVTRQGNQNWRVSETKAANNRAVTDHIKEVNKHLIAISNGTSNN